MVEPTLDGSIGTEKANKPSIRQEKVNIYISDNKRELMVWPLNYPSG